MTIYIWIGIIFCALNAAIFSGLNLAIFRISHLKLKVLAKQKNKNAINILALREHPNFLLSTILWANVSYNVLLTILTNSIMTGLVSFFFSTIVLTLVGEILPQSFFSKHALKISGFFVPMLKFYQFLLYPIAKPTAIGINYFVGEQCPEYYTETDLIDLIKEHINLENSDITSIEALGAIHFLELDDRKIKNVGDVIQESSLVKLDFKNNEIPDIKFKKNSEDEFLKKLHKTKMERCILVDEKNNPQYVFDVDGFFRDLFMNKTETKFENFCHKPCIITKEETLVGEVLKSFTFSSQKKSEILEHQVVLFWTKNHKRILTSDDIVHLLMQEIGEKK